MKRLSTLLFITLPFIVLLMLAAPGCVASGAKTIAAPAGCDARVTPAKRPACHACLRRGPHWVYKPHMPQGSRCFRP